MTTVGIKMLKERLSEYVAMARAGERIVITDRGEAVAEMGPLSPERRALKRALAAGTLRWSGRKPRIEPAPAGPSAPGETVAQALLEDRR